VILRLAVLVELRLVTDTDRQTQTDGHRAMASTADAYRGCIASRGKNWQVTIIDYDHVLHAYIHRIDFTGI